MTSELFGELTDTSPFATPWRVILVGDRPVDLLARNYLIQNLNPPNQLNDVSWIKLGKVMREVTLSTTGAKELVDFADEQNIDYIHFDAGWYGYEYELASDATRVDVDPRRNPNKDLDLLETIRYARAKGKKVMLYVNHRALERQLDTLMPLHQRWGVSGIKFGFVHVGSQRWATWLQEAVKKAADHNLIVDVHDGYRPSGFSRTYPNLLTQEGVLGNEGFPEATHNTILPFTYFVAGAADYTLCFNTDVVRPGKSKTTNGHQLALPVIYFSPLKFLFWYGKPAQYPDRSQIEFWKNLPTVWDEAQVIAATPGEFVSIARRRGMDYWLGVITNTQPRQVTTKLDFLDKTKTYLATIYEDSDNRIVSRTLTVNAKLTIGAVLKASGGQSIHLTPTK